MWERLDDFRRGKNHLLLKINKIKELLRSEAAGKLRYPVTWRTGSIKIYKCRCEVQLVLAAWCFFLVGCSSGLTFTGVTRGLTCSSSGSLLHALNGFSSDLGFELSPPV